MDIKKFATDKVKEQDGVWVDAGAGLKLKIARIGNIKYEEFLRKIGKPMAMQIRLGTADLKVANDLVNQSMAKHVLLDWENLEEEVDGKMQSIPYTPEKALQLIRDYPDFRRMVLELANEADLFRQADLKESQGNSSPVSSGSSTGDSTQLS